MSRHPPNNPQPHDIAGRDETTAHMGKGSTSTTTAVPTTTAPEGRKQKNKKESEDPKASAGPNNPPKVPSLKESQGFPDDDETAGDRLIKTLTEQEANLDLAISVIGDCHGMANTLAGDVESRQELADILAEHLAKVNAIQLRQREAIEEVKRMMVRLNGRSPATTPTKSILKKGVAFNEADLTEVRHFRRREVISEEQGGSGWNFYNDASRELFERLLHVANRLKSGEITAQDYEAVSLTDVDWNFADEASRKLAERLARVVKCLKRGDLDADDVEAVQEARIAKAARALEKEKSGLDRHSDVPPSATTSQATTVSHRNRFISIRGRPGPEQGESSRQGAIQASLEERQWCPMTGCGFSVPKSEDAIMDLHFREQHDREESFLPPSYEMPDNIGLLPPTEEEKREAAAVRARQVARAKEEEHAKEVARANIARLPPRIMPEENVQLPRLYCVDKGLYTMYEFSDYQLGWAVEDHARTLLSRSRFEDVSEESCMYFQLLHRKSRWTTHRPGHFACLGCTERQMPCLRMVDGDIAVLPLAEEVESRYDTGASVGRWRFHIMPFPDEWGWMGCWEDYGEENEDEALQMRNTRAAAPSPDPGVGYGPEGVADEPVPLASEEGDRVAGEEQQKAERRVDKGKQKAEESGKETEEDGKKEIAGKMSRKEKKREKRKKKRIDERKERMKEREQERKKESMEQARREMEEASTESDDVECAKEPVGLHRTHSKWEESGRG